MTPTPPLSKEKQCAQRRAELRAESEAIWAARPTWQKAIAVAVALAAIGVIVWLVVAGLTAVFGVFAPKAGRHGTVAHYGGALRAEADPGGVAPA